LAPSPCEVPWRFLAASRGRAQALEQARRAASTSLPVLLIGPTGAGKEVLAHDLHQHSPRRHGPFVSVDCAALDAERLDAQLFGHARGAFAGAHLGARGLVEDAADGTLFLDQIGAMAPEVQGRLLRFLESSTGEYQRMGESRVRHARVRIIAATSHAISGPDAKGFRDDLYFRLAGVRIDIPRPAPEDVRVIAAQLLRETASQSASPPSTHEVELISEAAAERAWQGGVRELRQCIERCVQLHAPQASWRDSWDTALRASPPTRSVRAAPALGVQPAAVGKLVADLLFLHTARRARKVAPLARSLQVSYQAVDARLQFFGVRLGESDRIDALIEEKTEELRSLQRHDVGLSTLLKRLLDS